jgi:hypothetical protein
VNNVKGLAHLGEAFSFIRSRNPNGRSRNLFL